MFAVAVAVCVCAYVCVYVCVCACPIAISMFVESKNIDILSIYTTTVQLKHYRSCSRLYLVCISTADMLHNHVCLYKDFLCSVCVCVCALILHMNTCARLLVIQVCMGIYVPTSCGPLWPRVTYVFVGHRLATKVYIGELLATG